MVLHGVEAQRVPVRIEHLGQDPADAGPVHAAAVEPLIAGYWQQGREQTRHAQEVFWTRSADDGLLPAGTDLTWLIDTATVIGAAETYLLVTRMLGWDLDSYEAWVATTWTRLLAGPGGQGLHRTDQWWTAARRAA